MAKCVFWIHMLLSVSIIDTEWLEVLELIPNRSCRHLQVSWLKRCLHFRGTCTCTCSWEFRKCCDYRGILRLERVNCIVFHTLSLHGLWVGTVSMISDYSESCSESDNEYQEGPLWSELSNQDTSFNCPNDVM